MSSVYFTLLDVTDDFVVIHKYPGISVHKDTQEAGLTMQLSQALGYPVYLVHRLDKVTSGVMVFARSSEAAAQLSAAFAKRDVQKFYLAISDNKPSKKQGSIIGDMVKARRGAWKLQKSHVNPAITRFVSTSVTAGIRLFLLKPETGKTHQLRVALKSVGAPILGDQTYGGSPADRTYLHAWQLHFPYQNQMYRYCADPLQGAQFVNETITPLLAPWRSAHLLSWPGRKQETL